MSREKAILFFILSFIFFVHNLYSMNKRKTFLKEFSDTYNENIPEKLFDLLRKYELDCKENNFDTEIFSCCIKKLIVKVKKLERCYRSFLGNKHCEDHSRKRYRKKLNHATIILCALKSFFNSFLRERLEQCQKKKLQAKI